jgi:hypothetical protein
MSRRSQKWRASTRPRAAATVGPSALRQANIGTGMKLRGKGIRGGFAWGMRDVQIPFKQDQLTILTSKKTAQIKPVCLRIDGLSVRQLPGSLRSH